MSIAHKLTEAEYERLVSSQPDRKWELYDGRLVEKPGMTWNHSRILMTTGKLLMNQLDLDQFHVFFEGRVLRQSETILQPDLLVVPVAYGEEFVNRPDRLAILPQPLPLIVEVWSPSTGAYDVDTKIPEYQRRGDLEIWRIHPFEMTLTAWRRQPDGTYTETLYREGVVAPIALPGVSIALADLVGSEASHPSPSA